MTGLSIKKFSKLEEYFKEIYEWDPKGTHDSATEIRGILGTEMKKLYSLSLGSCKLGRCLDKIRKERKSDLSLDEWKEQYNKYLLLLSKRQEYIIRHNRLRGWFGKKLDNVQTLDESNWNIWGSIRQLKFGRVVIDTLNIGLDPVFGALLNPTGGIVGPDNIDLYEGSHFDGVVMHGIVHDGGGYLINYHKTGPGYNYIKTPFTLFPSTNPLSTQFSGIRYWKKLIKKINKEKNQN